MQAAPQPVTHDTPETQVCGRAWLVLGSLASVVFGVLLFAAPLIGAVVLTWWIGAWAFVMGISLLALAFRLRPHRADRRNLSGAALHGV